MARSQNKLIDSFARNAIKLRDFDYRQMQYTVCILYATNNNEWFEQNNILAYDEIVRLASILASIEKIRITGDKSVAYVIWNIRL